MTEKPEIFQIVLAFLVVAINHKFFHVAGAKLYFFFD